MPRLLLRALLLAVPRGMLRPVLLLGLRLRRRRAVQVQRRAFRRRRGLPLHRRLCLHLLRTLVGGAVLHRVVLDVDDAALRVERGRAALPRSALSTPATPASAVAAEPPASAAATCLAFLALPLRLRWRELAVAIHSLLGMLGKPSVARLRRIGGCLRGFRWCGGTLSFSIHRLSSIATSSTGG